MRSLLSLVMLASLSTVLPAQPIDVSPTGVSGHHIGETASTFLGSEPKARELYDACRRNPSGSQCDRLRAALAGQRAEISTTDSSDFVFDQGRLIKLAAVVDGSAESLAMDLAKTLGPRSSEMDIQKRDASGTKWHDSLSVWSAPDAYILLFEDNNPSLNARRPVLVVESPAEHARNTSNPAPRSGSVKRGLQKVLSKTDPGVVSLDF